MPPQAKRLVICADGTWNIGDQVEKDSGKRWPTNVTKVARAIVPQAKDGTLRLTCPQLGHEMCWHVFDLDMRNRRFDLANRIVGLSPETLAYRQ